MLSSLPLRAAKGGEGLSRWFYAPRYTEEATRRLPLAWDLVSADTQRG